MFAVIRLSAGTAAVLGLKNIKMIDPPTTAYLLFGDGCLMECAFCPQSHGNREKSHRLGRVDWLPCPRQDLEQVLRRADAAGLKRVCLQGVRTGEGVSALAPVVAGLGTLSGLPVCVSAWIENPGEAEALLQAGADRVSIALDAAGEDVYARIKGGSLEQRLHFLYTCAERWPGRISTHLICGLGETDRELLGMSDLLLKQQVSVAMFAFAPLKGTALAGRRPPGPGRYRRLQAALYLLRKGYVSFAEFTFDSEGSLLCLGLAEERLRERLRGGEAFRTSGCPDCNRPYFNERPGGFIYNYPRPLTAAEESGALRCLGESARGRENGAGKMAAYN